MIAIGKEWQLQTAKNKFSEVVNQALAGKAQLVRRHGKPAVYVVAAASFDQLNQTGTGLKELLLNSPHREVELSIERPSADVGREVDL